MVINSQNKKILQTCLFVLVAIVVLGIGYASISAINLIINGNATASVNQENFIIHFIEAQNIIGTTGVGGTSIIESDDTKASFTVTGLTKVGDYAEAKYVVKNDSNGIGAEISLNVTNSNPEYFKVTETIDDNKLQAGDTTLATVKVEMIKIPIDRDVSTSVTATLTANPLVNESATGGDSASKVAGEPESFATDSWATIQTAVRNNNTSLYNVGDTKTVTINGTDYQVRIANKSINDNCGNDNYSQTACGFVIEFADIVETRVMNLNNTTIGCWPGSELYTYLQGDFLNKLPSDLKEIIIPTRVISGYVNNGTDSENFITYDKLYLLSGIEVHGDDETDTAAGTTHQLDYYQGMQLEPMECDWSPGYWISGYVRAVKKYNSKISFWWLRSIRYNSYYGPRFSAINLGGQLSDSGSDFSEGVAPAFRIG